MGRFQDDGIRFVSLTEKIDTSSASGKLVFHVFAVLAQFERDVYSERTKAGLAAAAPEVVWEVRR